MGPFVLSVAAELRAEAARQHLGVTELAARADMPHSTVSKSLNGKRMIDVEELAKLCAALGLQPAEIARRASVGGSLDDVPYSADAPKSSVALAAKKGTRKADQQPPAE